MSYNMSVSGIQAAMTRLNVSANDVANVNTEGYTGRRVVNGERPGGGVAATVEETNNRVSIEEEIVEQIVAKHQLKANAIALRAQADMDDTVLDVLALRCAHVPLTSSLFLS